MDLCCLDRMGARIEHNRDPRGLGFAFCGSFSHSETQGVPRCNLVVVVWGLQPTTQGSVWLVLARWEQDHDPLGPVEYFCGLCYYLTTMVRLVWLVWSKPRP